MGILLVGLIVNLSCRWKGCWLSMLALIVGFAMYQVGMYYTLRYGRPDRPDQILVKTLKGFDNRYYFVSVHQPVWQCPGNARMHVWYLRLKCRGRASNIATASGSIYGLAEVLSLAGR